MVKHYINISLVLLQQQQIGVKIEGSQYNNKPFDNRGDFWDQDHITSRLLLTKRNKYMNKLLPVRFSAEHVENILSQALRERKSLRVDLAHDHWSLHIGDKRTLTSVYKCCEHGIFPRSNEGKYNSVDLNEWPICDYYLRP